MSAAQTGSLLYRTCVEYGFINTITWAQSVLQYSRTAGHLKHRSSVQHLSATRSVTLETFTRLSAFARQVEEKGTRARDKGKAHHEQNLAVFEICFDDYLEHSKLLPWPDDPHPLASLVEHFFVGALFLTLGVFVLLAWARHDIIVGCGEEDVGPGLQTMLGMDPFIHVQIGCTCQPFERLKLLPLPRRNRMSWRNAAPCNRTSWI